MVGHKPMFGIICLITTTNKGGFQDARADRDLSFGRGDGRLSGSGRHGGTTAQQGEVVMTERELDAAANALVNWFHSQGISPADGGMIMLKLMAAQLVLKTRDAKLLQDSINLRVCPGS
jgi:hypothetical protein